MGSLKSQRATLQVSFLLLQANPIGVVAGLGNEMLFVFMARKFVFTFFSINFHYMHATPSPGCACNG